MLRPRWRKVLADLWENKARTLLVVVSIAVGIFAVGMVVGANVLIPAAMNTSYAASDPTNIVISTDPFDRDFLQAIRRIEGVAAAEGQRTVTVRLRTGPDAWTRLDLIARTDLADTQLDHLLPYRGAARAGDKQALIVSKTADEFGFAPGSMLEIELSDGARRTLPVAGVVRDLTAGKRGFLADGIGFVTGDTLSWLHQAESFDRLYVTVADGTSDREHIRQVAALLSDRLERSGRQVYQTDLYLRNRHPMASIVLAILNVLAALGVLLVFLSGSLIANTLSALLNQHLRQIGVIKLVGGRRAQIVGMYLVLILAFGAMALALVLLPSAWGAWALAGLVADIVGFMLPPAPALPFVPQAVAVQVAMALCIPLLAGLWPVLQGSRITVAKAVAATGLGGEQFRKGTLDRLMARLRGVSRPFLVSIRNTFRRKGRLALTLFTLALGGAIFIAVFNVQVGLNRAVESSTRYFRADVNLDLARLYRIDEVEREIRALPGIEHVEAWAAAGAQILRPDGTAIGSLTILAPPTGSALVEPALLAGRWLAPGDEQAITVNEAFWSDNPSLKPGDRLHLKVGDREDDWVVVGIFQFTGADERYAFANYESLAPVLHQAGQSAMFRVVTKDHGLRTQEALSAQLDERFRSLGYRVGKVEAGGAMAKSAADVLWILILVLLIMALLTAVVGSIGLAGTLSMNVLERTREIGVMRAIGAHDGIVMRLVIVEGLAVALISYALAALASFPITIVLSGLISKAIFNVATAPAYTAQGFIMWLAVVVALSAVASAIPARSACRMTIREVLAYE